MLIEATAVDSGGHFTQQVYAYCAKRKARRVWAVKGAGGFGRLVFPRRAGRAGRTSGQLYLIGVDTAKDVLYGRLKRCIEPGAGYVHFPASVDDAYFDQLTNETMIYRVVQGRRMRSYKPKSSGARLESVLKTEPTPATITPPESVVPRRLPPRRAGRPGGWVNGWR
jgi:phage terminase large subunit GpA-like protein